MTTPSDSQQGFSLLELLVVLMIAGMALALTSLAVNQYQRAHARGAASERAGREYRLSEAWFRASASGLVAIAEAQLSMGGSRRQDGIPPQFQGAPQQFSGTTLSPILAGQGVPTIQEWRIGVGPAGTDVLLVREEGRELRLSLPGQGALAFAYLDREGETHHRWPPLQQGTWPQLPAAIALQIESDGDGAPSMLVIAAVTGPLDPLELPYEDEQF